MIEEILEFLEHAGGVISVVAVAVIIVGFAMAAGRYAVRYRKVGPERDFQQFKIEMGRPMLLGLEILILADIIETITVEPTYLSLAVLAFLVVFRTIVSWALALEVEGCWPWQSREEEGGEGHA